MASRNSPPPTSTPAEATTDRRQDILNAALACAAGLALLGPARKAEALAGMNFNLGQGWFGAANDSMLVHLDPRQGEGDMYFGFANSYHEWLCAAPANTSYYINHYGQWLRYAFACVFDTGRQDGHFAETCRRFSPHSERRRPENDHLTHGALLGRTGSGRPRHINDCRIGALSPRKSIIPSSELTNGLRFRRHLPSVYFRFFPAILNRFPALPMICF